MTVCHGTASVKFINFPLNIFFSRTTKPISAKVGRKHAWGMGIQVCSNKGFFHKPLAGMH